MRHSMMILAVIAGSYLCVCLLAFAFQRHLVFYPDRRITMTPSNAGMTYRDVFFEASDGVLLHGWFVPASGTPWILLFCPSPGRPTGRREGGTAPAPTYVSRQPAGLAVESDPISSSSRCR